MDVVKKLFGKKVKKTWASFHFHKSSGTCSRQWVEMSLQVHNIVTLGHSQDNFVKTLLQRVAQQVEPILLKRKWSVGLLKEFLPSNPNLLGLNVNRGEEICIRVRRSSKDIDNFFPYEHLLGTMLHEITHIVHGPHDNKFYALLEELKAECELLMSQGITGKGFFGKGIKLDGTRHNVPRNKMREAALKAAEKRMQNQSVPAKLGGNETLMSMFTPAQLAAMAAEQRLRDNIWCGTDQSKNGEESTVPNEPKRKACDVPDVAVGEWNCVQCTYLNTALSLQCSICATLRPGGEDSYESTPKKTAVSWFCSVCTLENTNSSKCKACGCSRS